MLGIADLSRFSGTQQLAITESMTRLAGQQIALTLQFGNFLHLRVIQRRVLATRQTRSCNSEGFAGGQFWQLSLPRMRSTATYRRSRQSFHRQEGSADVARTRLLCLRFRERVVIAFAVSVQTLPQVLIVAHIGNLLGLSASQC